MRKANIRQMFVKCCLTATLPWSSALTFFYQQSWQLNIPPTPSVNHTLISILEWLTWQSVPPASKWPRCKFLSIPSYCSDIPPLQWKTSAKDADRLDLCLADLLGTKGPKSEKDVTQAILSFSTLGLLIDIVAHKLLNIKFSATAHTVEIFFL